MVNFGPLAAEIVSLVWGTPANFNRFCILAALLHGTPVVGVSQTAAFNRGRHLYSAGRPSRWAFAHILVLIIFGRWWLHILYPSDCSYVSALRLESYDSTVHRACEASLAAASSNTRINLVRFVVTEQSRPITQ